MTTELTTYQPQTVLTEQMDYARAVSSGSLLPVEYRGNPANVLIAVGLGASMGLSPAESLYRISVIKGKPSAGAELIAANVRKAGHKLRVRGDDVTCTATIVRADDPDYEFTVTRDMAWAKQMGLATNDNYKKQPGTMLQWRAITAVARLACPEALYGVSYTPDELREGGQEQTTQRVTAADFNPAADVGPTINGEVLEEERADTQPVEPMSAKTRAHMFALFGELNIGEDDQRAGIARIVGHPIASRGELTETEAQQVVNRLKVKKAEQDAGAEPVEPGLFEQQEQTA